MANEADRKIIRAWCDAIHTGGVVKSYARSNVYASGRSIYSYGDHFEMARILSDGTVWMNGDRYSVTTSTHQRELDNALRGWGVDTVTIPGEALRAARIDIDSIRIVHVEAERFDWRLHESALPPAGMVDNVTAWPLNWAGNYAGDMPPDAVGHLPKAGESFASELVTLRDGIYRWHTATHWLGDSVFTARVTPRDVWGVDGITRNRPYEAHFVSSFDKQESTPLYFLSELPRAAVSVSDAIESLKPQSVVTALDMGRTVTRQGDMFAIPVGVSTRSLRTSGADIVKRRRVQTGTTRVVSWVDVVNGDGWHQVDPRELCETCGRRVFERASFGDVPYAYAPCTHKERVETAEPRYGMRGTPLLSTAHTATEVATMPDGTQYARGVLYHDPANIGEWRQADHARRKMGDGKTWHVIARNTVPVQR